MTNPTELVATVATIVISAAMLYVVALVGKKLFGSEVQVQILVGERETVLWAQGSRRFQTASKFGYEAVRGRRYARIFGLSREDKTATDVCELDIAEYDIAAPDEPPRPELVEAFIIGCCWRARQEISALENLKGMNVLVVLNLKEERRAQLLRGIDTEAISRAVGARISVTSPTHG